MSGSDRRRFLKMLGGGALASTFPGTIKRALAVPANNATGTIEDVEHVVILMQENRSFDHYFGTLSGVRGFGDPRAVNLPSGASVFAQPNGTGTLMPFRPTAANLGLQFLEDLPHMWTDTHSAWNGGKYDGWVASKGTTTMAYMTREDIPFYYALADAFTICDAYHCSVLGPTDPNRYHMWTGWVGNDGSGGGPVIDDAEAGYGWTTFPERLQQAGIAWKVYQDAGPGLNAANDWGWGDDAYIGNFGDNSLLFFNQYQTAQPGSPLFNGALTGTSVATSGTLFDQLRQDVAANTLPQVSWIVSPQAFSEHPNFPANYGAWFVSQVLDALTSNPDVWSKTVFFLMYDENDGFFDHVVPPTPPPSSAQGLSSVDTTNEIFPGSLLYASGPYGLGVRVPMLVISPWSKGGWVNSQVFDHTSLIQFIERRFSQTSSPLVESNITAWRRAVVGDMTSAFDFTSPNTQAVSLPSTATYTPPDDLDHDSYSPVPPTVQQLPQQEPGQRPARALPYALDATAALDSTGSSVSIVFQNSGTAAVVFQVRSNDGQTGPWSYTVAPGAQLTDSWPVAAGAQAAFGLSVYGPNGFFRSFTAGSASLGVSVNVAATYDDHPGITLAIENPASEGATSMASLRITDGYRQETLQLAAHAGTTQTLRWSLEATSGWYDLTIESDGDGTFQTRLAGHVETGKASWSDPAIGR